MRYARSMLGACPEHRGLFARSGGLLGEHLSGRHARLMHTGRLVRVVLSQGDRRIRDEPADTQPAGLSDAHDQFILIGVEFNARREPASLAQRLILWTCKTLPFGGFLCR